jgi:hypothetical protein
LPTINLVPPEHRRSFPTDQEIWELYEKYGTVEAVADKLGVPRHEVSPIIDEMPLRQVYRRKGSAPIVYTDKQLLTVLKKAAKICGEPLTLPAYHKVAPRHEWPAALTITQRFGTWEKACNKAKVKVNHATGPRKGAISVEKCLVALRLCRADFTREAIEYNERVRELRAQPEEELTPEERDMVKLGEVAEDVEPSYERYVKWARANKQPSGPTVRSKVGPWRTALQLAYSEETE